MKTLATLVSAWLFATGVVGADSGSRQVDWSQTAPTLTVLNDQILDWHRQFELLSAPPVTKENLKAIVRLHFQKGPLVVQGFRNLQERWASQASDSEKKSKFLAVSHYFATHSADLAGTWAWEWYRCFRSPLTARYNDLAAYADVAPVPMGASGQTLLEGLSLDERKALFQDCRPTIADFLAYNSYPLFDDKIDRMTFTTDGVALLGRPPKDRTQFNTAFTFTGSPLFLFGMGL